MAYIETGDTIFDTMSPYLQGDQLTQLSREVGADESATSNALSMALPQFSEDRGSALPPTADEQPVVPRTLSEPPASPAVAAAVAEADRYATDVMTAFKKGQG